MTSAAFAQIIRIENAEDLTRVLSQKPATAELVLAPGNYGVLRLENVKAGKLKIRSEDAGHSANFVGLIIRESDHITLEALNFLIGPDRPAIIADSRNITFESLSFEGSLATLGKAYEIGFPTGLGLSIRESGDIAIRQSSFSLFKTAILIQTTDGVNFEQNLIHSIRSDGLDLAQVQNVTISNCTIRDFLRSPAAPDHADMIQFWTTKTAEPSESIRIENNILDAGSGLWTQSIFMRNELAEDDPTDRLWYRNVTVSGNIIRNAHHHGITVGETIGLTISENQVLWDRDAIQPQGNRDLFLPAINVSERSKQVAIIGNTFYLISGFRRQADWLVKGNISARNLDQ